jgi:diaminopimelate epimerase
LKEFIHPISYNHEGGKGIDNEDTMIKFSKYHALGNDYIIIDPSVFKEGLTEEKICRICHRNYGIGSDGILCGPIGTNEADFKLKIFNPDGSEAEKSGNGLRIFARYLWDTGKVGTEGFSILTAGGKVKARVQGDGKNVTIEMGQVSFDSTKIPVAGSPREVISEKMEIDGQTIEFSGATIGNPHCVTFQDKISEVLARKLGPKIEIDSRFTNRTNVQFVQIVDRANIKIEIWERGAGYTLASGSSSSAAAAVAKRLGYCDSQIKVHMPGGQIDITVSDDFSITMTGSVTKIADGTIDEEMFD